MQVYKRTYTAPVPQGAERVTADGVPAVRFKRKGHRVVAKLTPEGDRCRVESPSWYGWVNGKHTKLCANRAAAEAMLRKLLDREAMAEAGLADPYEEHQARPLSDHLA